MAKETFKIQLRKSSKQKFDKKINKIQMFAATDDGVEVGYNAGYSAFVEYGTKYMKAQPYFEPAINKERSKMKILLKILGRKILTGTERKNIGLYIKAIGLGIIRNSSKRVPVDTGTLKQSVYIKKL